VAGRLLDQSRLRAGGRRARRGARLMRSKRCSWVSSAATICSRRSRPGSMKPWRLW